MPGGPRPGANGWSPFARKRMAPLRASTPGPDGEDGWSTIARKLTSGTVVTPPVRSRRVAGPRQRPLVSRRAAAPALGRVA